VRVHFTDDGGGDYQFWVVSDLDTVRRIHVLIEDVRRNLFCGIGKPEPWKGDLAGWWSRRIIGEHRLVYRIVGKAGVDQRVEIAQCRYHYDA
jgi:toxin YoeB